MRGLDPLGIASVTTLSTRNRREVPIACGYSRKASNFSIAPAAILILFPGSRRRLGGKPKLASNVVATVSGT
jgi:hypothetical protein